MPTITNFPITTTATLDSGVRDGIGSGLGYSPGDVIDLASTNSGVANAVGAADGTPWTLADLGAAGVGCLGIRLGTFAALAAAGNSDAQLVIDLSDSGSPRPIDSNTDFVVAVLGSGGAPVFIADLRDTAHTTPDWTTTPGTFVCSSVGGSNADLFAWIASQAGSAPSDELAAIVVARGIGGAPDYPIALDAITLRITDTTGGSTMSIVAMQVRLPWDMIDVRGPVSSNTFHFDSGATVPTQASCTDTAGLLLALYGTGLDGMWSSQLSGAVEIAAYSLDDAKPRLPVGTYTGTLTPGSNSLPGEVTIKVGYRAPRVTGVRVQARRGTMHIGPLDPSVLESDGRLSAATMTALNSAFTDFVGAFGGTVFPMVVGTEANGFHAIERISLSNECGTVRRRQFRMTDRQIVAV